MRPCRQLWSTHPVHTASPRIHHAVLGGELAGLAVAAELVSVGAGKTTFHFGQASSKTTAIRASHASLVQSGIYHEPGSLASQLVVSGRDRLYNRCSTLDLPYRKTQKLVVATANNQVPHIDSLQTRSLDPRLRMSTSELGTSDTDSRIPAYFLSGDDARDLEPSLSEDVVGAVLLTESGVLDEEALLQSLASEVEDAEYVVGRSKKGGKGEGAILRDSVVRSVSRSKDGWVVEFEMDGQRGAVEAESVVSFDEDGANSVSEIYLVYDGDELSGISRRIHPSPMNGSDMSFARLNVGLSGQPTFGPIYLPLDTRLSADQLQNIGFAIQTYVPSLAPEALRQLPGRTVLGPLPAATLSSADRHLRFSGLHGLDCAGAMGAADHIARILLGSTARPSIQELAHGWE